MRHWKTVSTTLAGFVLACGGGGTNGGDSATKKSDAPAASAGSPANAASLPDPCSLVTDEQISDLLWKGMEANQRQSLQARNAKHVFTKRVEDVQTPPGRTCYYQYTRTAGDSVWGKGDFELRTLGRQTFDMFAQSSRSQNAIPGVGDQAFYMSNAAYGRRGNVGVEVVNFNSKDIEIELLKAAVARLP
jgi:hypothetical protein